MKAGITILTIIKWKPIGVLKVTAILSAFTMLLAFAGCGEEDIGESGSGAGDGTTTASSAVTESTAGNTKTLSTEVENQVKQTYFDYLCDRYDIKSDPIVYPNAGIDDVWIYKYYGTYNGFVAVMMGNNFVDYHDLEEDIYIDDILIRYPNSNTIKLWKEKVFYDLKSAFEQGLISKNDLQDIAYFQNKLYKGD